MKHLLTQTKKRQMSWTGIISAVRDIGYLWKQMTSELAEYLFGVKTKRMIPVRVETDPLVIVRLQQKKRASSVTSRTQYDQD